jgi:hypothetical protein
MGEQMFMNTLILQGVHKAFCYGATLALLAFVGVTPVVAEASATNQVTVNVGAAVPTTKILAIGRWTFAATEVKIHPIMRDEVSATLRLYLDGVIDEWFVLQDYSGVVFLLNVTDTAKARELLEQLPLGQAALMKFELAPLGPIGPLGVLLREPPK